MHLDGFCDNCDVARVGEARAERLTIVTRLLSHVLHLGNKEITWVGCAR